MVQNKVDEEVAAGRISGPFTASEAEQFFGGFFWTAPLGLVPKAGGAGDEWRMIENLSFTLSGGVSMNSLINSDDFPTKWGTAQMLADYVSIWSLSLVIRASRIPFPY
jgi:hypothetical protein